MQKRERLLSLAVGVLVGGWMLDGMLVEPSLAWLAKVRKETAELTREASEAKVLIDRQPRILADWRARHAAGLSDDVDAARFRVQQSLAAGARSSGFTIDNVGGGQLVPAASNHAYDTLRLTVAGLGSLSQVQAFLAGIEGAALPLRIERCELASSDGRKDQLDVALTISTRLVSAASRAGRAVPDGTVAWKPEPRDGHLDSDTSNGKPFMSERKSSRRERPVASTTETKPVAPSGWLVVGIVVKTAESTGFLRSLGDGSERAVHAGDDLDGAKIMAVESSGLRISNDGVERTIAVGSDLTGKPASAPIRRSTISPTTASTTGPASAAPAATTTGATAAAAPATGAAPTGDAAPAPAVSPFAVPTIAPDADRDAILQRLRQQRNRSP